MADAWPGWLLGPGLVLVWVLIALSMQTLFPPRWRVQATQTDRSVMLASLGVIGTLNALLLAVAALSVWQSFDGAEQAVKHEATAMTQLGRTLALYDGTPAALARQRLRAYGRSVVTREWPAMVEDKPSAITLDAFDALFHAMRELRPAGAADAVLLAQAWAQAHDLANHRNARLQAGTSKLPGTLWTVVLVGSVLTLIPVAAAPVSATSRSALVLLAVALGLVFHFVAALDRPYAGAERVTPQAIEEALDTLQRFTPRSSAPS